MKHRDSLVLVITILVHQKNNREFREEKRVQGHYLLLCNAFVVSLPMVSHYTENQKEKE